MRARLDVEIAAMKERILTPVDADHLIVEAIRGNALPASQLPKVLEAWETPRYEAFAPRTAWSLYNAFTEIAKSRSPRAQIEDTLRLTRTFRSILALS
jgi:hypothetical protein